MVSKSFAAAPRAYETACISGASIAKEKEPIRMAKRTFKTIPMVAVDDKVSKIVGNDNMKSTDHALH